MTVIECKNLSLGYDGKNVLSDINFKLSEGDYLCIVGENGSGKTTLMKGLLGFIKPYSGEIKINEPQVGYLPQQTDIQRDFPVTVREVILSGCLGAHPYNPFYTKKDKEKVSATANKLELSGLLDKCFQELSGGQRQRVLIARALCAAGNLLILDEPAAGLDTAITNEIYLLIESLNKNDKMTVVMVSHDINTSVRYASHILHIGSDSADFYTTDGYKKSHGTPEISGGDKNE